MPPLRSRPEDIPLLAVHFLRKYAAENGKEEVRGFTDEALAALVHYSWPGNVRELENAVERAVVICRGEEVRIQDFIPTITTATGEPGSGGGPQVPGASMAELERYAILKTLEHVGGATTQAAEILGISPRTIQYRLREYAGAPRSGKLPPAEGDQASRAQH
jgi:DNA-binding NtrC family response regulator